MTPPDDFEALLRQQAWRKVSPAWRRGVLVACAKSEGGDRGLARLLASWLWPSPLAWGGLAAIWLGLLAHAGLTVSSNGTGHVAAKVRKGDVPFPQRSLFAHHKRQREILNGFRGLP